MDAAVKLPHWLKSCLDDENESLLGDFNALVVYDYGKWTIDKNGLIQHNIQWAIRFKTRDERSHAQAIVSLGDKKEKLKKFKAWMIYPSGKIETFSEKDLVDVAQDLDNLYSESKNRILNLEGSVRDGAIFAYEYTKTEKTIFPLFQWIFQGNIPSLYSSVSLKLPKNWQLKAFPINAPNINYSVNDLTHRWVLRNLPAIRDEPRSPKREKLYRQIGINVIPPAKDLKRSRMRQFENWNDVARYAVYAQKNSALSSDKIVAKAHQLIAGKQGAWEKIEAICRYVQSVNYLAISMDLNKGGGHTPRTADQVLAYHYGDCKDMTALARSLLAAVDIDAYAVWAKVGKDAWIHESWPSPTQFNHCILGVRLTEAFDKPAIIKHPDLDNLMLFDPTMKDTPVGDIPITLEGTRILVGSEVTQGLIELPISDHTQDRLERTINAIIDTECKLSGIIKEVHFGNYADSNRSIFKNSTEEDYWKRIRLWISRNSGEATISKLEINDSLEENRFELIVGFSIPHFARKIGDELMVFKPIILEQHTWIPPEYEERHNDYLTSAGAIMEDISITFPIEYKVESFVEDLERRSDFSSYSLKSELSENKLKIKREIISLFRTLPSKQYSEIVDYYQKLERKETAPIILKKL